MSAGKSRWLYLGETGKFQLQNSLNTCVGNVTSLEEEAQISIWRRPFPIGNYTLLQYEAFEKLIHLVITISQAIFPPHCVTSSTILLGIYIFREKSAKVSNAFHIYLNKQLNIFWPSISRHNDKLKLWISIWGMLHFLW